MSGAKGIDEADPPGHAFATIKGRQVSHLGEMQHPFQEMPPGLCESGDVNNVDGDKSHQEQVNIDVHVFPGLVSLPGSDPLE